MWHRKFCGEGVPDYVFNLCQAAEPEGTKAFPLPIVNETYPLDENNDPTLDACLSTDFFEYYLTHEVWLKTVVLCQVLGLHLFY